MSKDDDFKPSPGPASIRLIETISVEEGKPIVHKRLNMDTDEWTHVPNPESDNVIQFPTPKLPPALQAKFDEYLEGAKDGQFSSGSLSREERLKGGSPTQEHFERILDEIATIRLQKVKAYGEGRYQEPDVKYAFLMLYLDIDRKLLRLKNSVFGDKVVQEDGEELRETLRDLANFGIMGVQLCDIHFSGEEYLKVDPRQTDKERLMRLRDNLNEVIETFN